MSEPPAQQRSLTVTAFWLIAAKMLSFLITFTVPLMLVRQLSQYEYGLYKQVFLLISTITSYGQFSFPMSSYYFFPRHNNHKAVVMNVITFVSVVGVAVALLFNVFPGVVGRITGNADAVRIAGWIGWTTCFSITSSYLELLSVLRQEVKISGMIVLGSALSRGALFLWAGWNFRTVEALVWVYLGHVVLQTGVLLMYLQRNYPGFGGELDWGLMRRQFAYSWPFALMGYLMATLNDLHSYVVARRFGAEEFAIYAVGCLQIPLTNILTEATGPLLIRQVNVLESEGRKEEIARLILAAARKLAFVFFPMSICLAVLGREFLSLLFTARYLGSYPVLVWNLMLIPLGIILFDPVGRAYPQYQTRTLRIRVAVAVLLMGLLYPAMAWFGPVGAMAAVVMMALLERVLLARFWLWALDWPRVDRGLLLSIGKLAVAALVAAMVTEWARRMLAGNVPLITLLAGSALYGTIYLALVWVLGGVGEDEKQMLGKALGRFGVRLRWSR